jgi:hypothetical protein
LEKFPAGEEEYPEKLLPAIRYTNFFKRILCDFQAGKGSIWENSRLHKGGIFSV